MLALSTNNGANKTFPITLAPSPESDGVVNQPEFARVKTSPIINLLLLYFPFSDSAAALREFDAAVALFRSKGIKGGSVLQ